MALFTIADLHLSFSSEKPMDIFGGGWIKHTEKLEEYWRYMVRENDTVVIPGDISWALSIDDAKEDFLFIDSLPGKKIIGKGNHDYWWSTLSKQNATMQQWGIKSILFLNNNAFEADGKIICGSRGWIVEEYMSENDTRVFQRENIRFRLSLDEGKKLKTLLESEDPTKDYEIIVFSHYPVITPMCPYSIIYDTLEEYGIKRCFYGHLHGINDEKRLVTKKGNVSFDLISADYISFTPKRIW